MSRAIITDWGEMEDRLNTWRKLNFPLANPTEQLLGVQEEVGELAHAHLKEMQGIRGDKDLHRAEARDAIGDIMIYLQGYCGLRGWSLEEILWETVNHVLKRDWIADPLEGNSVATNVLKEFDDGHPPNRSDP